VKNLFYADEGKAAQLFGGRLETPFGPAAGPHTQMAQNIAAAYAGGARFFELKTVQTIDGADLPVQKPCIRTQDECYNVEWSTELTVAQAYAEYATAWFLCKLLAREYGFGSPDGFLFNMSVGYDYEGITSKKIDDFIEGMRDASGSAAWRACREAARKRAASGRFSRADAAYLDGISARVCDSITLSTLHGCPPDEIERIASYLMREKRLHTFIKLNPTLLGYEFTRGTLDSLGYGYMAFDDRHFEEDLQYSDAVPMLRRLMELAAAEGVRFGVKLTNTLPVDITKGELPGEEMYMSGRALFPLAISLAAKFAREFSGKLHISMSGGIDASNIEPVVSAGVWPVTVATTLLKTGGYNRLASIAGALRRLPRGEWAGIDADALCSIQNAALESGEYHKAPKPVSPGKARRSLPLLNCVACGNCVDVCPNRANVLTAARDGRQILHVDKLCNECGNCDTFCPYDGAPYKRKFTLFSTDASFADSENEGFLPLPNDGFRIRLGGEEGDSSSIDVPEDMRRLMDAVRENYPYLI
jgi:putative selenate reductase